MSGQEQIDQNTNQKIQNLETIVQQLESDIRNVENTIECQVLKRVTINFLQILKSRAETKIQALRQKKKLTKSKLTTNAKTPERLISNTGSSKSIWLLPPQTISTKHINK